MDFFYEYGAAITIPDKSKMFATKLDTATDEEHQLPYFRIIGNNVILLVRSYSLISVHCDFLLDCTSGPHSVAERIKELAFTCGIYIAQALINVINGCAQLLWTNSSSE